MTAVLAILAVWAVLGVGTAVRDAWLRSRCRKCVTRPRVFHAHGPRPPKDAT